ncbi:Flp pilus assembly protein TadG [Parafrankia irregularis]|uniref:Flp pilus assembly protein TadG n=1 Tax=Parafrankia irregularis TaxID=795642 RepID=A0A0S4R0G3_9ACTN|nr:MULTISPECIES: TadE/TadG family type IV pilus assembly protein [Parafrankia]MBE3204733.1 pilus assembly protein [Parafrankia sp. CH37]CUU60862.1 Flp pilus assembly protein TadG [Parafrankia irregularis]
MISIIGLSRRGRHGAPARPGTDQDAGSAAVELTLLAPLIILMLLLIVYAGRAVNARGQVDTAAHTAARAASLARTPTLAIAAAQAAVAPDLTGNTGPCTALTVEVDTSQFRPGGVVRATVACRLDQSDLAAGLPVPGGRTVTAAAAVPIDLYRGVTATAAAWPPAGTDSSSREQV